MNKFSFLLPLKDRTKFTKRLLNNLNKKKCPYKLIIADGGKDKRIEAYLADKSKYPYLNYEYIRYPFDQNLSDFYSKMSDAVSKIDSEFVSAIDNDDLIDLEGIPKCIKVLEDKSFSSARGAILENGKNIYSKYPNSIIQETAALRMKEQTLHFHGNWHNVVRRNHLVAIWKLINVVRPNNFRIVEQINGYLHTLWGNSFRGEFPLIIRKTVEMIILGKFKLSTHFPPQDEWIKADYWPSEFNKLAEVVSASISYFDNISLDDSFNLFCKTYPLKLPHLKDLLNMRIKEAKLLGYNYERINKMQIILKDLEI